MASEKLIKIADEIQGLTLMEASELVKVLEEKLGVSAAAPVAVAAVGGAPAAGGAAADSDHKFGLRHLLVDPDQPVLDLAGDRTGTKQNIGMSGRGLELDPETLQVKARCQRRDDLDIAGVARAGIEMEDPRRLDPRPGHNALKHRHAITFCTEP